MDFTDLKEQYKEKIKRIHREKKELNNEVTENKNQLDKCMTENRKIESVFNEYFRLMEGNKVDEAVLLLKTNEFNNINDVFGKGNDLVKKLEEIAKNYRNIMNRIKQLTAEANEESITCPNCNGEGYTISKTEFFEIDTGRSKRNIWEPCTLCKSEREIPTKKLLDC